MYLKPGVVTLKRFGVLIISLILWLPIPSELKPIADETSTQPSSVVSPSPSPGSEENIIPVLTSQSPTDIAETIQVGNVTLDEVQNVTDQNLIASVSSSEQEKKSNHTSSNYIIEYKPQIFYSPEDIKTQQEWGGNCTLAHWDSCKALQTWFGNYEDPKDGEIKNYVIDCRLEPVVCLTNSWTVTRCNLLCMSRCNREIQFKYDKFVSHSGECKAHAHHG